MEAVKRRARRQAQVDAAHCVACGCCLKVCPVSAIRILKGQAAYIDPARCVGCGRCAAECPASVIALREVPA